MDVILSQMYAFCDFSNVPSFFDHFPGRDEWGSCLPKFRGDDLEVPAKHLLDFHECMHKLSIVHEYVLIKCSNIPLTEMSENGVDIFLLPTFLP
jgi:hypothetical protein